MTRKKGNNTGETPENDKTGQVEGAACPRCGSPSKLFVQSPAWVQKKHVLNQCTVCGRIFYVSPDWAAGADNETT